MDPAAPTHEETLDRRRDLRSPPKFLTEEQNGLRLHGPPQRDLAHGDDPPRGYWCGRVGFPGATTEPKNDEGDEPQDGCSSSARARRPPLETEDCSAEARHGRMPVSVV